LKLTLPECGYSPREVERICGLSPKYSYRLIRNGTIEAFLDCVGNLKVHPHELYRYMKERE
jgi:predicted site-specific integrase-resolvase